MRLHRIFFTFGVKLDVVPALLDSPTLPHTDPNGQVVAVPLPVPAGRIPAWLPAPGCTEDEPEAPGRQQRGAGSLGVIGVLQSGVLKLGG